jgi:hypothetical protein
VEVRKWFFLQLLIRGRTQGAIHRYVNYRIANPTNVSNTGVCHCGTHWDGECCLYAFQNMSRSLLEQCICKVLVMASSCDVLAISCNSWTSGWEATAGKSGVYNFGGASLKCVAPPKTGNSWMPAVWKWQAETFRSIPLPCKLSVEESHFPCR